MNGKAEENSKHTKAAARADRLKQALKANMAKRKAQTRARADKAAKPDK